MPIKCPVCEGKAKSNGSRKMTENVSQKRYVCTSCGSRFNAFVTVVVDVDEESVVTEKAC